MTERSVVNKYTLVPVGAVIAAIVITIGVMNWVNTDKERILTLEMQTKQLEKDNADLRHKIDAMNDKLDAQSATLAQLGQQLAIVNSKLDERP